MNYLRLRGLEGQCNGIDATIENWMEKVGNRRRLPYVEGGGARYLRRSSIRNVRIPCEMPWVPDEFTLTDQRRRPKMPVSAAAKISVAEFLAEERAAL